MSFAQVRAFQLLDGALDAYDIVIADEQELHGSGERLVGQGWGGIDRGLCVADARDRRGVKGMVAGAEVADRFRITLLRIDGLSASAAGSEVQLWTGPAFTLDGNDLPFAGAMPFFDSDGDVHRTSRAATLSPITQREGQGKRSSFSRWSAANRRRSACGSRPMVIGGRLSAFPPLHRRLWHIRASLVLGFGPSDINHAATMGASSGQFLLRQ